MKSLKFNYVYLFVNNISILNYKFDHVIFDNIKLAKSGLYKIANLKFLCNIFLSKQTSTSADFKSTIPFI